jgi:hypothetical protein
MSLSLRCTINWRYSQKQVNLGSRRSGQFQVPDKSLLYALDRKETGWAQPESL